MSNKKKVFWFHYNKPQTQRTGKVKISLHFDKKCHIVDSLKILVPTVSKIKKTQPLFVMSGYSNNIKITNNNATIC